MSEGGIGPFDLSGEALRFRSAAVETTAAAACVAVSAALGAVPFVVGAESPGVFAALLVLSPAPIVAVFFGRPPAVGLAALGGAVATILALLSQRALAHVPLVASYAFVLGALAYRLGDRRDAIEGTLALSKDEAARGKVEANRLGEKIREAERRRDALRTRAARLGRLVESVQAFERPVELEAACREIVRQVRSAVLSDAEAEKSRVILYRLVGGVGVPAASDPPARPGEDLSGEDYLPYALEEEVNLLIADARKEHRYAARSTVQRPVRSLLIVPLSGARGPWGALRVESAEPNLFAREDLESLAALAVPASLALENAEVFSQTQARAVLDALTGLFRRHVFDERFPTEWKRAERYKKPLSLLLLDIDHFKRLNDTLGHEAGDEVLRRVAETAQRALPPGGWAARYGGEEFALCLPERTPEEAAAFAEKVRRAVCDALPAEGRRPVVTVSLGVASYPHDATDPVRLVEAADAALYRAKEKGRNRVVSAGKLR